MTRLKQSIEQQQANINTQDLQRLLALEITDDITDEV
jgi:hypothetical protein